MPTYQYVCAACDEPLEAVQGFHDAPLTTCPTCHSESLRKVYGNVGVVFKGGGFYRTDSRTGSTGSSGTTSPSSDSSGTSSSTAN